MLPKILQETLIMALFSLFNDTVGNMIYANKKEFQAVLVIWECNDFPDGHFLNLIVLLDATFVFFNPFSKFSGTLLD